MVAERTIVAVEPDSELGRILDQATSGNVVLERGGERFRIVRERPGIAGRPDEDDPFANYDPERAQAAWASIAGILRGVDADALIAELREQRGQDSTGRPDW